MGSISNYTECFGYLLLAIHMTNPSFPDSSASRTDASVHYDKKTIWLHWLTAFLVFGLWIVAHTIDWFPRGTPRVLVRSLHISAGTLLAGIVLFRIWWRLTSGAKLPPSASGMQQTLATLVHLLLYVCVIATLVIGFGNTWIRGDNIFDLFRIPAFDPGNKELRSAAGEWHELAANILLVLALAHAAVALAHHYLWKDGILRRMLPKQ